MSSSVSSRTCSTAPSASPSPAAARPKSEKGRLKGQPCLLSLPIHRACQWNECRGKKCVWSWLPSMVANLLVCRGSVKFPTRTLFLIFLSKKRNRDRMAPVLYMLRLSGSGWAAGRRQCHQCHRHTRCQRCRRTHRCSRYRQCHRCSRYHQCHRHRRCHRHSQCRAIHLMEHRHHISLG